MARLYLVRHGKAAYGWGEEKDPGLSEPGRIQAASTARVLEPLGPLPLVTSPLARTRETAAPLAKIWDGTPLIEPRIAEIPSPSDGITDRIEWLRAVMTDRWPNFDKGLQTWRQGVVDTLNSLSEDTVVVSHFIAINVAVGEAIGDDRVVVFKPDNTSVTILETNHKKLALIKLGVEDETIVL